MSGLTRKKKRQYYFDVWKIGLKKISLFVFPFFLFFFSLSKNFSMGFEESFNRVGEMFEFFTELYYFHWTLELWKILEDVSGSWVGYFLKFKLISPRYVSLFIVLSEFQQVYDGRFYILSIFNFRYILFDHYY